MTKPGTDAAWLPLAPEDLEVVGAIARRLHPGLPERPEVLGEKRELCPEGCRKLVLGGRMMGYGLSHPWRLFDVPPLDRLLGRLPERADCLYLHDVAILPEARGGSQGLAFVALAADQARRLGLRRLACVSVYGTTRLWSRAGFRAEDNPALRDKLAGYGADAAYLIAEV